MSNGTIAEVSQNLRNLGRVRGVTVDDAGRRLFIASRTGERAFIRIVPL
jgi:hypothetical protein